MKIGSAPEHQATRRIPRAMALAAAFTLSLSLPARADRVTPPPVPADIQVRAGHKAFLEGHGVGTQNYVCLPCPNPTTPAGMCPDASGFAWLLFTPEATLFQDNDRQVITHFASPNPSEHGTIRVTWQHSADTSTVWAKLVAPSVDRHFVAADAIPWLLLQVSGAQAGPTGGRKLTATTFIQRVNTSGGVAPSMGCASTREIGAKAFMPYSADYIFYTNAPGSDSDDDN